MSESPITRSEMKAELFQMEERLLQHTDGVRTELLEHIERLHMESLERTEKVETTLLKEFRKWAISFESRFKANDALVVGFNERLFRLRKD
jgi:hypothetical protein